MYCSLCSLSNRLIILTRPAASYCYYITVIFGLAHPWFVRGQMGV